MINFIDLMGLKRMLEKLGLAKTHLELKKMMSEVVGGTSKETISYNDFLNMMLGKRNAILKLWVNTFRVMGGDPELGYRGIRVKGRLSLQIIIWEKLLLMLMKKYSTV